MNKTLVLATLVAAVALAACGKKEEVAPAMEAASVLQHRPAAVEAAAAPQSTQLLLQQKPPLALPAVPRPKLLVQLPTLPRTLPTRPPTPPRTQ
jgi:hypothetical protein